MIEDAELEVFRQAVNCAAVLERMTSGWKLDVSESTRRALKYRRGAGEIIIVNHDGRGWWDATGSAKGDVFNLVQHLEPSLNFGIEQRRVDFRRGQIGKAGRAEQIEHTLPRPGRQCARRARSGFREEGRPRSAP